MIMLRIILLWLKTIGLYRHSKTGSYYIVFGWAWESTNTFPRERKVVYFSLRRLSFNVRMWWGFFETIFTPGRASWEFTYVNRFTKVFPWFVPRPEVSDYK